MYEITDAKTKFFTSIRIQLKYSVYRSIVLNLIDIIGDIFSRD